MHWSKHLIFEILHDLWRTEWIFSSGKGGQACPPHTLEIFYHRQVRPTKKGIVVTIIRHPPKSSCQGECRILVTCSVRRRVLKIRVFNHGTNVGHRFTQKCTPPPPPPPPPDSECLFPMKFLLWLKTTNLLACAQGAWGARHSQCLSALPKQNQWGTYLRDAPLQGHYPTSKCTRFIYLFIYYYFPLFLGHDTHWESSAGND